jgi:ribosomal protein S27E
MRSPSAADVVRIWELGRDRAAWYRGLLLLAPCFPARTFRDLAALTIGQRNVALFAMRERLFGARMAARVRCPRCGAQSEFAAQVAELCPHKPPADAAAALPAPEFALEADGARLRCRCLTSEDLARAADGGGGAGIATNRALVQRAVIGARAADADVAADALPDAVIGAVAQAVVDRDPQSELMLAIDCPDCGHAWSAPFDAVAFVWTETANLAQRLLNDVHLLASAYGWREADILAMSAARRHAYIEKAAR